MIILAQASDSGMWILIALGIAVVVALAAWGTHWIWYFRSFGMFAMGISPRYFLGVIGLLVPIVGIIHGVLIWAGAGARVGVRATSVGSAPPHVALWCCDDR